MPYCAILSCKNDSRLKNLSHGGVSYHRFPKDATMKENWINATGRINWMPVNSSTVCSEHFTEKDLLISKKGYRYLHTSAVPTINIVMFFDKKIQNPVDAPPGPSKRLATPIKFESQSENPIKKSRLNTSLETITSEEEHESKNSSCLSPRKQTLIKRLRWSTHKIKNQNLKIRRLQKQNRKLKQEVDDLEQIFITMEDRFTTTWETPDCLKNTNLEIDNIVNVYKTLAKIPSVLSGRLSKNGKTATVRWSIRNLDKGRTTKYLHNYILDTAKDDIEVIAKSDFGIDVSNEILSSVSPSEAFRAVVREEKEAKDIKKQYLEVWSKDTLVHSVDLNALDMHGEVYSDSELSSLEWSPDETALVYVAEKKLKKSEPYIKRKAADKGDGQNEDNIPKKGEEFVYRQDWGEQLVGRHMSAVVVFRLADEAFTVLQGLPEAWCPGQVRFSPTGDGVVGVALVTEPSRLGLMFCTNRPGYIFHLTMDGIMTKLSEEGMSVRSPRVGGGRLAWLQRRAGGPHHACLQLVAMDWDTKTLSTVIPIVEKEMSIENGESFHGLYCQALPAACFSGDGRRLVVSTPQRDEARSYVVDLQSNSIRDISNKRRPGSTLVLDMRADALLAVCSDMTTPGQVYVAKLPASGEDIKWVQISPSTDVPKVLVKAKVEYLHLEHKDSQESIKTFTALYLSPAVEEGKKLPLVVWPHGGPHSSFVNAYSLEAAMYTMLGFACLQVNYRGSTGGGDARVRYLPARAGAADVRDCKLATDEALRRHALDPRNVCLSGGSHGGFLVAHLSGQYPDTYCAVVTRNPVIDVASMFGSTDIPDWCAVEAGYEYTEGGPPAEEQLLGMRRCSPLAHVHRVRAPTALLLGGADKRVPCFQGLQYARRLEANGVPTRVYMYDDNHSLSSLPAEMDHLVNGAHWLLKHLRS